MITLYSTNCPRCKVLEKKMERSGIQYETNTSIDDMVALGMTQAPMLAVDGKLLDFAAANEWINNQDRSGDQ